MSDVFTATIDRRAEQRYLARFRPTEVTKAMTAAGKASAQAAAAVMRSDAPIGTAAKLSQYYRRMSLGHGTLRRSVRAAPIRGRGSALKGLQGRTIGWVIGPLGRNAFTRAWVEDGFLHRGGTRVEGKHWTEHAADTVLETARVVAEGELAEYGRG